jgi:hypothetical protein
MKVKEIFKSAPAKLRSNARAVAAPGELSGMARRSHHRRQQPSSRKLGPALYLAQELEVDLK